ncbi:MAG: MraY family glycosyltransferase [Lautropia sp.]
MTVSILAIAAFCLTALTLPLLVRVAFAVGWIDLPTSRKNHEGAVPLAGGVTIFLAVALTLFVTGTEWPAGTRGLACGLALVFLTGLWDDRFPLQARYRLFAQLAASIAVVAFGDTVLRSLGRTFTPFEIGLWWFAYPMTVVALTGLVNAFNMADGLDGLCSGYVMIALASLLACGGLLAYRVPGHPAPLTLIPVAVPFLGAIAAFLLFNMRHPWRARASVFLGDAGSMALGFLVGWLCLRLAGVYGAASLPPVVPVYIVALPLFDMFSCMIRRHSEGITPMTADRKHLHHLLMTKGLDVRQAVALLHLIAALVAALGILGWIVGVPEYLMFWTLIAAFVLYTRAMLRYWRAYDARLASKHDPIAVPPVPVREAEHPTPTASGAIAKTGAHASVGGQLMMRSGAVDGSAQKSAMEAGVSSQRR